jgi:hypothetical protein
MKPTRRLAASITVVAASVAAIVVVACTGSPPRTQSSSSHAGTGLSSPCGASCHLLHGVLPTWARAGFRPATTTMPYVLGVRGDIVGAVFGDPLSYPPMHDRRNKILWISKLEVRGDPLKIRAVLRGSNRVVNREVVGGPGPSIIDMPAVGCWTFTLSWSGHTDTVYIEYHAG